MMQRWFECTLPRMVAVLTAVVILVLVSPAPHRADGRVSPASSGALPEWIIDGIIYEIHVRNFSEEGTFAEVTRRIPELDELGVNILWLMPFHPVGEKGRRGKLGWPYAVRDYFSVDSTHGTIEELKALVDSAHARGMKVIMDMVVNHAANDHVAKAEHPEWFARDGKGNFTRVVPDWTDIIDWNFNEIQVRHYLSDAMIYWVKEVDIDGYRCEMAGMAPLPFWSMASRKLKRLKTDIFLLAEWEEPRIYKGGFQATYSLSLYRKLMEIRRRRARPEEALDMVMREQAEHPEHTVRLRFIENHNEPRAGLIFGNPDYKPFATFIFTVPGIPMLYMGQEVGSKQELRLRYKTPVDWSKADPDAASFYRNLIRMRREHIVLRRGRLTKLRTNHLKDVMAYALTEIDEVAIAVLNFKNKRQRITVDLDETLRTGRLGMQFSSTGEDTLALFQDERLEVELAPHESRLYFGRYSGSAP